jgi:3'(2'), 5'-bisphosphate nucleotidase
VLVSRNHFNEQEKAVIQKHAQKITHQTSFGSSIKACKIAEGLAEISYRLSNGTKEWDTAASQIIVEEAGGLFVKPDGSRYRYNRPQVINLEGYIIVNRKENILL